MEGRRSIESTIRAAIREGRLAPGATVPSTRTLASQLGVARGTVVEAYAQLAAEGWLRTRQGAPTTVAPSVWLPAPLRPPVPRQARTYKYDLFPGEPDVSIFPMSRWLGALRKVAARGLVQALSYDADEGSIDLRRALARYLERARGVAAGPEQIFICSGSADALATIAKVIAPGRMAIEDPGLSYHCELVTSAGASIVPLPVDAEGASAEPGDVAAALLTPAHQFPLGMSCSAERRDALIVWARKSGGLIIEDDYDGEFRFDREPIGAMQGRAPTTSFISAQPANHWPRACELPGRWCHPASSMRSRPPGAGAVPWPLSTRERWRSSLTTAASSVICAVVARFTGTVGTTYWPP